MSKLRTSINRRLGAFAYRMGYQIRPVGKGLRLNPYDDQAQILDSKSVKIIFDVGANVGQTVGSYRSRFPNAVIHSFEPFEESFQKLKKHCASIEKVHAHHLAIADTIGTAELHTHGDSVANSLLPNAETSDLALPSSMSESKGTALVPITTLDAFCADQKIDHIDILKMDIQGAELKALRGASDLLARGAIDLIYTEVWFSRHYEGQADFCELRAYLSNFGFRLYHLYELCRGQDEMLAWGDALFVSPRAIPDRQGRSEN